MLDTLEIKYHLLPKYMQRLWYLQRRIATGNLNTDYIYIYNWVMSREQYIPVGIYRDSAQDYQLLLFKGNISPYGSVHLEKFNSILRHIINFPKN